MFYPLLAMTGDEWWVFFALAVCLILTNILALLLLGRITYHTKDKVEETKEVAKESADNIAAKAEIIVEKLDVIDKHTNGTLEHMTLKLEAALAQNEMLHKRIEQLLPKQKGS